MHTQCPNCKTSITITAEELSQSRAIISCAECDTRFDALELLAEDVVALPTKKKEPDVAIHHFTDIQPSPKPQSSFWSIGFSLCLITIGIQIYWFESYNLSQNPHIRPWLEKICQTRFCELPPYKNLNDFSILHGSFTPGKNNHFVFKTAIVNQASFEQNYPSIQLTLIDFNGQTFAERVFQAKEYIPEQTVSSISPEVTAEISMNIAKPSEKIGGYRFKLI